MKCVVCAAKKARARSLTCSSRHAATLRAWQWRSRRKTIVFEGVLAKMCPVCEKPLLPDVRNGQVIYHVNCAKFAKKCANQGSPYERSKA